jgi:hypothetical protein
MDPDVDWIFVGKHQAIIKPEIWDGVQRRHTAHGSRNQRRSLEHALSGIIRCTCGKPTILHPMAGPRMVAVRCPICGWQRSYRYAEATVLSAFALLDSDDFSMAVEEELRKRDAIAQCEQRIKDLEHRRHVLAGKLDRALEAFLSASTLSPALQAKCEEYQAHVQDLDRDLEAERTVLAGQTRVSEWCEFKRRLLSIGFMKIWSEATASRPYLQARFEVPATSNPDGARELSSREVLPKRLLIPHLPHHSRRRATMLRF